MLTTSKLTVKSKRGKLVTFYVTLYLFYHFVKSNSISEETADQFRASNSSTGGEKYYPSRSHA